MKQLPPSYPHTRPSGKRGLIAAAILVACLLLGGLAFAFWREWIYFSQAYPLAADAMRFTIFAGPISIAAGLGYTAVVAAWRWLADWRSIRAIHQARQTLAERSQGLPTHITDLSYTDSHKAIPLALPEPIIEAEIVPNPPSIPTFTQLLDQGLIGNGRPLILGYNADTGQAITGSWKDLYSVGVGALQGAGKTWLLAFLLSQSAAQGGRLIICDPHAGDDESLANRIAPLASAFMCDVASTDNEILAALRLANDKLERRKAGSAGAWPIVVVVDEWSSLLRGPHSAECMAILLNISEQGRKYSTNGILSAQGWTKNAAGLVRQRLTSHYVLRQNQDEAGYQLGLKAQHMPADIRLLPDATGYFLNVRGDLAKVVIPKMNAADVARCGEMIDRPAAAVQTFGFTAPTAPLTPLVASSKPNGSQMVANTNQATTASQTARIISPEAAHAATLFLGGKSPAEIVQELRGVKSSQGRTYQTALNEVTELIRQGVQS